MILTPTINNYSIADLDNAGKYHFWHVNKVVNSDQMITFEKITKTAKVSNEGGSITNVTYYGISFFMNYTTTPSSNIQARIDWLYANSLDRDVDFNRINSDNVNIVKNYTSNIYTCGDTDLLSHVCVALINNVLVPFSNQNISHLNAFVGMTKESGITGESIEVVESGVISLTGWGLTPNVNYFATTSGDISTDDSSTTGFKKIIGLSQSSSQLLIVKLPSIIK